MFLLKVHNYTFTKKLQANFRSTNKRNKDLKVNYSEG